MTAGYSRRCSFTEQPNGWPCVFNSSCRKKRLCFYVLISFSARNIFTEEENKTKWLNLLGLYRFKVRISDNGSTDNIRRYHTVCFYKTVVYSRLLSELALFLFVSRLSIVLNHGGGLNKHSRGSFLQLRFWLWMKEVWCLYTFLV